MVDGSGCDIVVSRCVAQVKMYTMMEVRHYVWKNLFPSFPHGIRGLAGFAYGISRLPWSTFLALNFVAAGLWSGVVVSAGYAFGQFSETSINNASSGLGIVMLVAFLGLSWLLSRKLDPIVARY